MPKKGCLGCSFPVLIGLIIFFVALFVIGFLAGPLGPKLVEAFGKLLNPNFTLPGWISALKVISIAQPRPDLPAERLFINSPFLTNTLISAWITIIVLAVLSFLATRRIKLVPRGVQSLMEFATSALLNFCNGVAGEKNGRRFFPVVATIFLFVIFNAWLSLIPGFGSILVPGYKFEEGHWAAAQVHLLRGANTDINFPLALALVSFVVVTYFGIRMTRIGFFKQFFNFSQFFKGLRQVFTGKLKTGLGALFFGVIDIIVGFLELLSYFIRIISFTFRLFGNMTAGEILLLIASFLIPYLFAVVFYGLELFVGFVQALVFAGLTLVFLTMATSHHGEEEESGETH